MSCETQCRRKEDNAYADIWGCVGCVGIEVARRLGIIEPPPDFWQRPELQILREELEAIPYISQAEVYVHIADGLRRANHRELALGFTQAVVQDQEGVVDVSPLIMSQALQSHALTLRSLNRQSEANDALHMARYIYRLAQRNSF